MRRIGILVGSKGRGSNMAALIEAFPDQVAVVIGSQPDAPALARAESLGVPTCVVDPKLPGYGARLVAALEGCHVVCLAGYLRLLPDEVLASFPARVLNIHPALLPKFGGKGMYGHHVHEAVIAAGETESGCTVHRVSEHYDEGPILLQLTLAVDPAWSAEDLAAEVLKLEHQAYPQAVRRVLAE